MGTCDQAPPENPFATQFKMTQHAQSLDVISGPDFFFRSEFRQVPVKTAGMMLRPEYFRGSI
jgi:hypothetical protein